VSGAQGHVLVAGGGLDLARVRTAAGGRPVHEVAEPTPDACRTAGVPVDAVGAVLGASPRDDLAFLPALSWVHSGAAGVDGWLAAGSLPDGVTLTSATGNGAIPLAEHALMLLLVLSRDAPRWAEAQRRHEWDRFTHGELAGTTLGIVGYGHSGRDLARKAQACHMRVQALRHTPSGTHDGDVRLLYGPSGLRELLTTSDHVAVTAPLTPATRGLIGAAELALLRPGAFVVVVSRGGIVDDDALADAVRTGRLGGAGLDAHGTEPLPPESPLWDLPNVVVTPHNGATTPQTAERGRTIALDNVRRWAAGLPLRNVVDRARGY
jgi:phosphoglycerate dehydrogenase-like enzyme